MPQRACFLLLAVIAAWTAGAHLISPGIDPAQRSYLIDCGGTPGIPLERYLWRHDIYPVAGICAGGQYLNWEDAAYSSRWHIPVLMLPGGGLSAFGKHLDVRNITVITGPRPARSVLDVAPTACGALGLHGHFDGASMCPVNASQVVVIYVDALGWYRYSWARHAMRNLSALRPSLACCVYPSISNVNSAAMLTGACPERSGVDRWENRTIMVEDAIDVALKNGVSAAWIDGPRPPISLWRGIIKVNDTNGDASTDDEVTTRAVAEYDYGTRLLYVHLSDTDRALHASGPYSQRSLDAAARADAQVGRLVGRLRHGTLVIVVADHGGHDIAGGMGDHGSLLPQDMLIPFAARLC